MELEAGAWTDGVLDDVALLGDVLTLLTGMEGRLLAPPADADAGADVGEGGTLVSLRFSLLSFFSFLRRPYASQLGEWQTESRSSRLADAVGSRKVTTLRSRRKLGFAGASAGAGADAGAAIVVDLAGYCAPPLASRGGLAAAAVPCATLTVPGLRPPPPAPPRLPRRSSFMSRAGPGSDASAAAILRVSPPVEMVRGGRLGLDFCCCCCCDFRL